MRAQNNGYPEVPEESSIPRSTGAVDPASACDPALSAMMGSTVTSVGKRGGPKFDKFSRNTEIVNIRTKKDEESAAIVESFGIIGKVQKKSVHFSNATTGRQFPQVSISGDRHNKFRASPYSKRLAPAYNIGAAVMVPKRADQPASANKVEVDMSGENQVGGERVDRATKNRTTVQASGTGSAGRSPLPPARKQLAQRQHRGGALYLAPQGASPGLHRGERDRSEPMSSAFHNNYRPSQLPGLSGNSGNGNNAPPVNLAFCPKNQINQVRRVYENAFLPTQGKEPTELQL